MFVVGGWFNFVFDNYGGCIDCCVCYVCVVVVCIVYSGIVCVVCIGMFVVGDGVFVGK